LIWEERHHLYLGQIIGFLGKGVIATGFGMHSWTWILIGIGLSFGGDLYTLDDVFQHKYNKNTPFHRLDVLLLKLGFYKKLMKWLDTNIFKKEGKDVDKH
jgi:hypothetical protein